MKKIIRDSVWRLESDAALIIVSMIVVLVSFGAVMSPTSAIRSMVLDAGTSTLKLAIEWLLKRAGVLRGSRT